MVDGVALGDAAYHSAVPTTDRSDRIVPFHKLSQWLTYSLIELVEQAGIAVIERDDLTALPEYRNGGLLIDTGIIGSRAPLDPRIAHAVDSEPIVEWRALTVSPIDALRDPVRAPAAPLRPAGARPTDRRRSPCRPMVRCFELD